MSPAVRATVQALAAGRNWRTNVFGTYSVYFDIRALALQGGTRYTARDERVNVRLEESDGVDEVTISEPQPVEVGA